MRHLSEYDIISIVEEGTVDTIIKIKAKTKKITDEEKHQKVFGFSTHPEQWQATYASTP